MNPRIGAVACDKKGVDGYTYDLVGCINEDEDEKILKSCERFCAKYPPPCTGHFKHMT